ncbi:MAG: hypothetical protein CMI29_06760 [Opitutae bacterium]|nr:hypothetical protein [Opitutae bacterium]
MSAAREHASRRANAAAAAAAADMVPINSRRSQKRPLAHASATPAGRPAAFALPSAVAGGAHVEDPMPDVLNGLGTATEIAKVGTKTSQVPRVPPGSLPRDENDQLPLLQSRASIDADESYGAQEHALSSYLKLHPVLSLESTNFQTLQLLADLVESSSIPTKELEVVPKSHDDGYLRPPNTSIGERPCCFGDRCICVWMARWRYGDDTDLAFLGTEFLLPSQAAEFRKSGKLPHTQGKCLVCSRYVQTYIYKCARADPTFKPDARIPLQAYGNALGFETGESVPTHASVANDSDGYRQEALLFVDEQWADTAAARGGMASLLWRPCVKFDTSHYEYVRDQGGLPRLVQRHVGAADETPMSHFYQPVAGQARRPLPANAQATPPPTSPSCTSSPHSPT